MTIPSNVTCGELFEVLHKWPASANVGQAIAELRRRRPPEPPPLLSGYATAQQARDQIRALNDEIYLVNLDLAGPRRRLESHPTDVAASAIVKRGERRLAAIEEQITVFTAALAARESEAA